MITFESVRKEYADGTVAIHDLSFTAPQGKLTVLVGPSGCGKTTTLRMINRLIYPTAGEILLNGEPTASMPVIQLRRRIGYVIQHVGLFPHRNVVDNVGTTARLAGVRRKAARSRAYELLERVGLQAQIGDKYPWQLSGGQQQRVGVARALAADPEFLLMDEPFSAVDPIVRKQLQEQFLQLQRDLGKTIVMVTHDIDEALLMGDDVAVFRQGGELVQFATPEELLRAPADEFVAAFIGQDRGYRSLGFRVASGIEPRDEPAVVLGTDRSSLARGEYGTWRVVVDAERRPLGWAEIAGTGPIVREDLNLSATTATPHDSLRRLFNAALSSPAGRGVIVDDDGRYSGVVELDDVIAAMPPHAVPTDRAVQAEAC